MEIKKYLITGGSGFIGSNLALALQAHLIEQKGYKVIILDDFSKGRIENLAGFKGEVISDNIITVELDRFKDIDAIFHCAAITDTTIQDEQLMTKINFEGFKRFLEFAVKNNKKFIYSSSASVYGRQEGAVTEQMAGNPLNIYAKSKWQADCLAMNYIKQSNTGSPDSHVIGLRYFNVFGKGEQFKGKMASMVWQLTQQIKSGKRPRIFKWGKQKRDHVYVKDVVRANILSLNTQKSAIVNVGSGKTVSFNYIIEVLNKVLGTNFEPEYFDNPYEKVYQNHTQADLTLAKEVINYSPEWKFEDAVQDYLSL